MSRTSFGMGFVTLKVYDILGREITTLVNEEKPAGEYEVEFNASSGMGDLVSGMYFFRLQAGDPSTSSGQVYLETKKMILMK
ncbi:MAG: T9SS type A sorting domain-containing protein [Ignavibacteriaceae bacterium]|nr:T9SS type A sorting domain-containing protein [Ignavibacteriaceae bacterium]